MEDNIAKKQLNRTKSTAQVLIVIICAIIAASIISGAAFDVTRISGRSMDDTLYGGKSVGLYDDAEYNSSHFDVIRQDTAFDVLFFGRQDTLGDKALLLRTKKARRGDIVVFMHESGGKTEQWIKRVIGVSGDTVRISDGKVYLNGKELDESYAHVSARRYRRVDGGRRRNVCAGRQSCGFAGQPRHRRRENAVDGRSGYPCRQKRREKTCFRKETLIRQNSIFLS